MFITTKKGNKLKNKWKTIHKTVTILTRTERRLQVGKELVNTYMYLIWKAN